VANQDLSAQSWMFPVYVSAATDRVKTFTCTKWGACNANGMQVHVPSGALPEAQSDGHIAILDTSQNMEFDGWAVFGHFLICRLLVGSQIRLRRYGN
jgi:hypothetical protein